jgi:hypothetical protein
VDILTEEDYPMYSSRHIDYDFRHHCSGVTQLKLWNRFDV